MNRFGVAFIIAFVLVAGVQAIAQTSIFPFRERPSLPLEERSCCRSCEMLAQENDRECRKQIEGSENPGEAEARCNRSQSDWMARCRPAGKPCPCIELLVPK